MTTRVSIYLKWRASLICFRACFLPGRAKYLSAPQYKGLDRALGIYEDKLHTIYRQLHMKLSALLNGRYYPLEIPLVLISVRGRVDPRVIVRPDGISKLELPMSPSVIEPTKFGL